MTSAQKTILIQELQVDYTRLLPGISSSLANGTCSDKKELLSYIPLAIDTLYRYKPFTGNVTDAFSLTIAFDGEATINFTLANTTVGVTLGTLTAETGTAEEIATALVAEIEAQRVLGNHRYFSYRVGTTIYFWSYAIAYDFADTKTATTTVTTTIESMEGKLSTILNSFNCLTIAQLCNIRCWIKNKLKNIC